VLLLQEAVAVAVIVEMSVLWLAVDTVVLPATGSMVIVLVVDGVVVVVVPW
jgi:hypothetical protein